MGFTAAVGVGSVRMDAGSVLERDAQGVLLRTARSMGCRTEPTTTRMGAVEVARMDNGQAAHNEGHQSDRPDRVSLGEVTAAAR